MRTLVIHWRWLTGVVGVIFPVTINLSRGMFLCIARHLKNPINLSTLIREAINTTGQSEYKRVPRSRIVGPICKAVN